MSGTDFLATAAQYDANDEHEADRLRLHPMERALTLDAIVQHLEISVPEHPESQSRCLKIADIGGATGVYAFALADICATQRIQADIHLRDLAPKLVALAQIEQDRRIKSASPTLASLAVGSALNADLFPATEHCTFNAVLLLGPLYHLIEHYERITALKYAISLLRSSRPGAPNAVLFAAFIPRTAHLRDLATRDPTRLVRPSDAKFYAQYLQDGRYVKPGRSSYHVGSPEEVHELVQAAGGRVVELIGVEGILGGGMDRELVGLDESVVKSWLNVMKGVARQSWNLGAADHWVAVIEKVTVES